MAVVLYIAICVCPIAYPYFSNLIKILSNNRKIRKLKEERELEDKILSNNRKISSNNRKIRNLKEEERELEEEIKMVLEKLERYKN